MAAEKFDFLVVGVPLSPLHNCISIGQELCLRGHNVTVLSFAGTGDVVSTEMLLLLLAVKHSSVGDVAHLIAHHVLLPGTMELLLFQLISSPHCVSNHSIEKCNSYPQY